MMRHGQNKVVVSVAGVLICAGAWSCDERKPVPAAQTPTPTPTRVNPAPAASPSAAAEHADTAKQDATLSVPDQIARALAKASPKADPSDARARDAAADGLGRSGVLLDTTDSHVMWGQYDPTKGVDEDQYNLIQLPPLVWARLYLSTFMFGDRHEVRQDGDYTVLEIDAKFRDKLPPGEYPHPFWHTPEEWNGYRNTASLVLVFADDHLAMALYKDGATTAGGDAPKWDRRWRWTDAKGVEQPRVAQYSYLFSKDNPHAANLDKAYRRLEAAGLVNNCAKCHGPDQTGESDPLVLLIYPNQALAARHSLAAVLREETMPPEDEEKGIAAGLRDEKLRNELIRLADEFEKHAEAALGYEDEARTHAGAPATK